MRMRKLAVIPVRAGKHLIGESHDVLMLLGLVRLRELVRAVHWCPSCRLQAHAIRPRTRRVEVEGASRVCEGFGDDRFRAVLERDTQTGERRLTVGVDRQS